MSLISTVHNGLMGMMAEAMGTPAPWDDWWYQPVGGEASASGMRITPENAKRIAIVLACVSIIARNVAMAPAGIFSDLPGGGKKAETNHPIYDLLRSQPNDQQTAFEFKQQMQSWVELRGNAYAEILPGPRGAVDQLVPMHPDRVTVEKMRSSGRLRYRYNDPLTNTTRYMVQEEVFHLRNFMDDSMCGQSTVSLACDTFGVALSAQDYLARFFRNDVTPGGFITGANFKNNQDRDAFLENLRKARTGANRHKLAVLEGAMDVKTLSVTAKDAELLDGRKFSRIEICSIFGVPPHLVGETEKTATYASVEQFNIMFATQCILARLVMWEQAIQRDLIIAPKFYCEFSMDYLLRGDTPTRYAAYKTAIENGFYNQDEARAKEGLNPIPSGEGQNYWRPLNWAPLGQLANPEPAGKGPMDTNTGDITSGESDTTDTAAPAAAGIRQRLMLLASAAAGRCVRKEVMAVRKLAARNAEPSEFLTFYQEHAHFLSEVLNIPLQAATEICDAHCRAMGNGDDTFLAELETTGPATLAHMATKGVLQ